MLTIQPESAWIPGAEGAYLLPEPKYREAPGLNFSLLKHFDNSPSHFHWARRNPEAKTPSRIFLCAVHAAVLEPERFAQDYVCEPEIDLRTKAGLAWKAEHAHQQKLTVAQWSAATAISRALWQNHRMKNILANAKTEVSCFVKDANYGVLTKCRIDILTYASSGQPWEFDLKTVDDALPKKFWWKAQDMHWIEQRAFYGDRLVMLGEPQPRHHLVPIESDPPHAFIVYHIPDRNLARARQNYNRWLEQYISCAEKDEWPSYEPLLRDLERPGYEPELMYE